MNIPAMLVREHLTFRDPVMVVVSVGPPHIGNIFKWKYPKGGPFINVEGQVTSIDNGVLVLDGFSVFPVQGTTQVGIKAVLEYRSEFLDDVLALGFKEVVIRGIRVSGKNPNRPFVYAFVC